MSDNKNTILEKTIKDKMSSISASVDTDSLWDNLEEFVPEKDHKKGFLYFKLTAVLFVFSLVLFYFSTKNLNSNNNVINNNTTRTSTINNSSIHNSSIHNSSIQQDVNSNTLLTEKTIATKSNLNNQKSFLSSSSNSSSSKPVASIINSKKEEYEIKENELFYDILREEYKPNNTKVETTGGLINQVLKTSNENLSILNYQLELPNLKLNKTNYIDLYKEPNYNTEIGDVNRLSLLAFPKFNIDREVPKMYKNQIIMEFLHPLLSRHSFYVGLRLGGFTESMVALNNESINYVSNKTKWQSSKPSYGLDLKYQFDINHRWYINTGLTWINNTYLFHPKWEGNYEELNAIYGSTTTTLYEYEEIGHLYRNHFNVPLNIGYYAYHNQRFSMAIDLGVEIDAYTSFTGKFLNKELKLEDITALNESKNNLSYMYGLKFTYDFNQRLRFNLHPQVTTKEYQLTYENIITKNKINTYNILLGINYKI